jgi:hypothetical protein
MRVDLYTKAVLTVIAAALVYIAVALTPVGTKVQAQSETRAVVRLVDWTDKDGNAHPFPLPVTVVPSR